MRSLVSGAIMAALCTLLPVEAKIAEGKTSLTVTSATTLCAQASLGTQKADPDESGRFVFVVDLSAAGELVFQCGRKYSVHLSPGDDLRVRLENGNVVFSGRGAAENNYLATPAPVTMDRFMALVTLDRDAFQANWREARDQALKRISDLADTVDADFAARERARTSYAWALGQVLFPFFHWRESNAGTAAFAAEPPLALENIVIEVPEWQALDEYQKFLAAYLHENARRRIADDPELQTGDNRWLRAEMAEALALKHPALRLGRAGAIIEAHVGDNGARDVDAIWKQYLALSPPAADVERIKTMIAEDHAKDLEHRTETYQTVDGVKLKLRILPPVTGEEAKPNQAAVLWFHGGSWSEGAWWHCPILCQSLRERGITVVAVELRTGNRFDAGPLEQMDDGIAAYRWVRERAAAFGVDRNRIGIAGFSSGATLALLLTTRGVDRSDDGSPLYPAITLVMGACADPTAAEEDGWFRRRAALRGKPTDYSPMHLVRAGQPSLLAIHADHDEYCNIGAMRTFDARYRAAGNRAALTVVSDAGHFFPFYQKAGVASTRAFIDTTLTDWGW
jgi:acetyl esterase/lipase